MPTATRFFALEEDLVEIADKVDAELELDFVEFRHYRRVEGIVVHESMASLPNLGRCVTEGPPDAAVYVVGWRRNELVPRAIPQYAGGTVYAMDQLINPGTVTLCPAGWNGDGHVLMGELATVHEDDDALELLRAIRRAILKTCRQVGKHRVGPAAKARYDAGGRCRVRHFRHFRHDIIL